jgi:hypothetical protein
MGLFANNLVKVIVLVLGLIFLIGAILFMGNLAWRHPDRLKERYLVDIARYPKWFPFEKIELSPERSNRYMWSIRIATLLGTLLILGLGLLTVLGFLGVIK